MRFTLALLRHLALRLDRNTRRLLIFASAGGMTFFALTTAAALRRGDMPDLTAGVIVLAALATVSAMAWTAPRHGPRFAR